MRPGVIAQMGTLARQVMYIKLMELLQMKFQHDAPSGLKRPANKGSAASSSSGADRAALSVSHRKLSSGAETTHPEMRRVRQDGHSRAVLWRHVSQHCVSEDKLQCDM